MKQCQSCGMPLSKDPSGQGGGTEKDGSISSIYCSLCYQQGKFCYPGDNLEEFQKIVEHAMKKSGYGRLMRTLTRRQIPQLARWKSHDSPRSLWFKRKSYGRGWTPASRQGRVILGIYLLLIILRVVTYRNIAQEDEKTRTGTAFEADAGGNLLVCLLPIFVLTVLFLIICYRTGEKPKRQWGEEKKKE